MSFSSFWTEYSQMLSQQLLSCTNNDVFIDSTNIMKQPSWFSATKTSILMTSSSNCFKSSYSSIVDLLPQIMNKLPDRTSELDKVKINAAKKIRLHLTPEQKKILKSWFHGKRWLYNRMNAAIIADGNIRSQEKLRRLFVHDAAYAEKNQWVLNIPYDIRDRAMHEVLNAYASNYAIQKKKPDHTFRIQFQTKKDKSVSIINIDQRKWNHTSRKVAGVLFPDILFEQAIKGRENLSKKAKDEIRKKIKQEPFRCREKIPDKIEHDFTLQWLKSGEFYICIPEQRPDQFVFENQEDDTRRAIIALDPGVRTFGTGYDPEGLMFEWGKNDFGRILRLCHALDQLQSRSRTVNHYKRYRMRKAMRRIRTKIRNLVDEFHRQFSGWLVRNFQTILLPEFESKNMVCRAGRKIHNKTARAMLTWSHYRFRQHLLQQALRFNCRVILYDESYKIEIPD